MILQDIVIDRIRIDKFGHLFLTLHIKKEDITPEEETKLREIWEVGGLLAADIVEYQVEEGYQDLGEQSDQFWKKAKAHFEAVLNKWCKFKGISREEYKDGLRKNGDIQKSTNELSTEELVSLANSLESTIANDILSRNMKK